MMKKNGNKKAGVRMRRWKRRCLIVVGQLLGQEEEVCVDRALLVVKGPARRQRRGRYVGR